MRALALDTAVTCITVAAKNDDFTASLTLDIGMRQSERLLPAIDYILKQVELAPSDLDYTVLTEGPGSFTGLRLGFAALKAIELAGGVDGTASKIPLYGINSLDYYAAPFLGMDSIVVPVIDAHKDKFYAKAFFKKDEVVKCDDWEAADLEASLLDFEKKVGLSADQKRIFVCGLEAKAFVEAFRAQGRLFGWKMEFPQHRTANFESLFYLAEEKIAKKEPPLKDYDGPEYFRASEAEQNAEKNKK